MLVNQSLENRKIIEEVGNLLNERAKIEAKYSKGLDKLANEFAKLS